jgi:pyruvate,orthophosphate dikinase
MTRHTFLWDVDNIDANDSERFGGKATGLARMRQIGLPVPPAVVISTEAFRAFRENGGRLPDALKAEIDGAIQLLEKKTGKAFGGPGVPLLLSVRSGAKISMPGMMDTILNLGLDARSAAEFVAESGNRTFVGDTWLRFWAMYADTVLGIDSEQMHEDFSKRLCESKTGSAESFSILEKELLAAIEAECGEMPPVSPRAQLDGAVTAVFESWDSPRAKAYRKHHKIPDDLGTAVVIQAMAFGNLDMESGTGVAFTRDPITGEHCLFGEYLPGHQGEDLVAGTKTPESLRAPSPEMSRIAAEITNVGSQLETLYKDALDIEFTVERGTLYLLQVRSAKRTAAAAVRIAVEMANEGLISREEAINRVSNDQLHQLVRPGFLAEALDGASANGSLFLEGVPAAPGHASGVAVLDSDRAVERAATGESVILVRPTTSPLDVRGMLHSQGIVTARGGSASHAAVVARALDKPCVVGCSALQIDTEARTFRVGDRQFAEGELLSIDGKTGRIYAGAIPMDITGAANAQLSELLQWADGCSGASIWASLRMTAELESLEKRKSAGIGIVPAVDLLIAKGQAEGLIRAVEVLSADPMAPVAQVEAQFQEPFADVCREFLSAASTLPVAIRLPRLSGTRARHMVDGWATLDPRMLLPLGAPRLIAAFIKALGDAARDASHAAVTLVLPAACDIAELVAFKKLVDQQPGLRAGVLVQNVALLSDLASEAVEGVDIWLDIPEIVRTFQGWADELSFSADLIDEYAAAGNFSRSPLRTLHRLLLQSLRELAEKAGSGAGGIGVELGAAPTVEVIHELQSLGFRTFSVPLERLETLRLSLGQATVKGRA